MTKPHDQLKLIVCEAFQIEDLFINKKSKTYVVARSTFFYLLWKKNYAYNRLSQISKIHHTSIMYSVEHFEDYYSHYFEFKSTIDYIISECAAQKSTIQSKHIVNV